MTEWSGASATVKIVKGKPVCMYSNPKQLADLFGNSAAGGVNKFSEKFNGGLKVAPQDYMMLSLIAPKGTTIKKEATTLFDANNNDAPVQTRFHTNFAEVKSDPIIAFTNTFTFSETLDDFEAFINNSEDPLNAFINFVPDGTPVAVTSSIGCAVGDSIAPGQTCVFSFDLPPNTTNWAFEIFADAGSLFPIFDLVATDIPEPPSVILLGLGLLGLLLWRASMTRAGRRAGAGRARFENGVILAPPRS
jgi:PEP-CTERM motif